MSTEIFPMEPQYSEEETVEFKTLVSEFESGREQRRAKWGTNSRRRFRINFEVLEKSDADILYNFYIARQGSYDNFYFVNKFDGFTSQTAFVVGYTESQLIEGTFSACPLRPTYLTISTGPDTANLTALCTDDGAGSLVTPVGVTLGTVVYDTGTYSFLIPEISTNSYVWETHKRYRRVRFSEDALTREHFAYMLFRVGLELVEVFDTHA
jgi:phage-related protein